MRIGLPLFAAVAAVSLLLGSTAKAGSYYWFGDDNNKWNQIIGPGGTNWSSSPDFNNGTGGASALPSSTSDVFFVLSGAGNLTTELGQSFSINSLTFTLDATSPVQINDTPGTHTLTIGAGGITDNGPSTYTINAPVVLGASETWANNAANPIAFNGVISGAAANNLTIGGTGVTVLTGADTYAGSTNVFTGTLRVTGANGAISGTSGISLGAGTSLVFDNTTFNNNNRIGSATGITSNGGTINLIGNGGVATTQTIGTLTLGPGATVVQSSGTGAVLTFGASGGSPIPSLNRLVGGTVNFVPGSGANVNLPNAPTPNGILGGWAVTGTAAGNNLNWAALDGSNNVIPYSGYTQLTADTTGAITSGMTGTAQQTNNIQYNATSANTPFITANTTINTLYVIGGSGPIAATNIPGQPPPTTENSNTITYWNGITFGNGLGSQANSQNPATAVTLTIGAGGIISSGATGIGHYNNKSDIPNMGFIGYLFGEFPNSGANVTTDIGQITVSPGVPDLVAYTAADGNLRLASVIVDTPVTITGTTTASLTNASNIVTLTGTATTAGLAIGESVRNLTGLVNGVQKITGITDATHFTIATNANATSAGGTAVFGTSIGLTKSGPGLLDISNGNTQTNKPNNLFTGKVTINEGILLINQASQLGFSPLAPDNLTFNGGGLRTYAGLSTNSAQGWTVGTRGGSFAYSGGGTSTINNKITGVGGFTYYSRGIGGGNGMTIILNNNLASGGGGNDDYQGTTSFLENPAQGGQGDTANNWGNLQWGQNNQVPANSPVVMNVVAQDDTFSVQPNNGNYVGGITTGSIPAGGGVSVNINGHSDHFGSLAGDMNIRNFSNTSTLTIGANNLSTLYTGSIYGAASGNLNTTFPAGAGTLVKVGTGTQTFAGTNNFYTGPTKINGGTLLIGDPTVAAGMISTSVLTTYTTNAGVIAAVGTVNVGDGVNIGALGGNGTINGPVLVTASGHLAPAMSSSTYNPLTINEATGLTVPLTALTINAGGTLDYNFSTPSAAKNDGLGLGDVVSVTGGNVVLSAGGDSLNVSQLPGFGLGTYPLITDTVGTLTDNATFTVNGKANFNYAVLAPGATIDASLGGGTVPAGNIWLEVLQGNPALTWLGQTSNSWDLTSVNWGGDNNKFTTGANVTFDDNATNGHNNPVSVVAGGVTANSMLVNGTGSGVGGQDFTFSGGPITVTTTLTKNQAGSLTFNDNVTSKFTAVSAGTVTVGAGTTYNSTTNFNLTGAGILQVNGTLNTPSLNVGAGTSLTVAATGTLGSSTALSNAATATTTFNQASQTLAGVGGAGTLNLNGTALTLTAGISAYSGPITGTGDSITVNGATADVTLSGNNTYTGATSVLAGFLRAGSVTAFGTNPSVTISGPASTLDVNGTALNGSIYTNVSVGGAGVAGNGAIINNGPDQDNALLGVTMTANTTFGGTNRWFLRGVGATSATLTGGGFDLTKTGANAVGFGTLASVTGVKNININQGTLVVADSSTVDNTVPGSIFLNPTGTLSIGNYASLTGVVISKPIVIAGGTLQTDTNSASGNATLGVGISINAAGNINAQSGSTLTLNSLITNGTSSTAGVTYGGGGTVVLGVASNYGGPTTISGGTVRTPNVDNTLPIATDLTVNSAVLDLAGHNQQIASLTGNGASSIGNVAATPVTLTVNGANNTVFAGSIVENGKVALVKAGPSTLTLTGQNLYSGGTTISNGTLAIGGAGAPAIYNPLGTSGVTLSGGRLALQGKFGVSAGLTANLYNNPPNPTNDTGPDPDYVSLSAMNAHLTAIGPAAISVPTTTNGKPSLDFSNNAYATAAAFGTSPATATTADYGFTTQTQYEAHFAGLINIPQAGTYTFSTTSDDGSVVFLDGVDAPVVNNNNYQGATTVNATYTFAVAGLHQIDIGYFQGTGGSGLLVAYTPPGGVSTTVPNSILFSLNSTFSTTQAYNNNVTVAADSTIDVSNSLNATLGALSIGANKLSLTGSTGAILTMGNTTLTGNATFDQAVGTTLALGAVGETGTLRSITKTGLGALNLTTGGTYTGGTTVSAGTLLVTNSSGSATGTGAVIVAFNGILGGTGSISGPLTLNGHLSPGVGVNAIGTITLGTANFATNGILDYDVSGAAYDSAHAGALTLGTSLTVNINALAGFSIGTYTLVTSTGITGSPTFAVNHSGPGDNPNFSYSVSKQGNNLVLTINAATQTWTNGAGTGQWNFTDHNWSGAGGGIYADNSFNQVFDDTAGAANGAVTIPATVKPLGVVFANSSAVPYTISGADISGPTVVVIKGPGTVTLSSPNTYTGGTNLLGGTLNMGDPAAIGAGTLTIAGGTLDNPGAPSLANNNALVWAGSFTFAGSNNLDLGTGGVTLTTTPTVTVAAHTLTVSGPIGDNGAGFGLTVTGNGILTLAAANTYSGTTTVAGASNLFITSPGTLGGGTAPLTVSTTGTVDLGGTTQNVGAVTLTSGTIADGTLVAPSYTVNNPADVDLPATLTGTGALTKTLAGTLTLDANNSYSGGTTISGGAVSISSDSNLGAAATLTINAGTLKVTSATTLSAARGITLGSSGGTIDVSSFTATGVIDPAPATPGYVLVAGQITGTGGLTVVGPPVASGTNDTTGVSPYLLVLDATNNNYAGPTTINNATVANDSTPTAANNGNYLPATTVLNLINNGVYSFWGAGAAGVSSQTLAGLMGDSTSVIGTENAGTVTNFVINTAVGQSYTFAGVIRDAAVLGRGSNGTAGAVINVTIGGAGEEVFSGANLYKGSTTITGGTLTVSSDGNLGTDPATSTAGNLTLNGGQLHVTGGAPLVLAATRGFTAGANGGTLRTDASTPLTIQGVTTFSNTAATLNIAAGSYVKFSASANAASVAAGSSVTVATGATLELAGTASALSDGTTLHGVNVVNNSSAAGGGLLVSGTTQKVGGIDGTGTTHVNDGSDLTATHIVQSALVIGVTGSSPSLVTIDASDVNGNPTAESGGFALAGSLGSSGSFASGALPAASLITPGAGSTSGSSSLLGASLGGSGGSAAVPEPSTMLLLVLGSLACVGAALRRRVKR